uniref:Uncharacterized protein n=1 Tax=Tetradesmus obliquus TaxID=3088 RepID=A0A383WN79_TETOB|eukprot:jgi/Sobl393_1/17666/SZX78887.1
MATIWDKQQLVRDFVWCMRQKGKPVGLNFDLKYVDEVYHALKQGCPVSALQVRGLDRIIKGYYINKWQAQNYPGWKGKAPAPVASAAAGGFAFVEDDG